MLKKIIIENFKKAYIKTVDIDKKTVLTTEEKELFLWCFPEKRGILKKISFTGGKIVPPDGTIVTVVYSECSFKKTIEKDNKGRNKCSYELDRGFGFQLIDGDRAYEYLKNKSVETRLEIYNQLFGKTKGE